MEKLSCQANDYYQHGVPTKVFLDPAYHRYQTYKLKHQSQQALPPRYYQVVYSQPVTNNVEL